MKREIDNQSPYFIHLLMLLFLNPALKTKQYFNTLSYVLKWKFMHHTEFQVWAPFRQRKFKQPANN